ncbi:MAG: hypothetical protein KA146_00265 [Leptospiraceae bacterium]|nr:hypothetical protein [Leptospiraceae bacterium]
MDLFPKKQFVKKGFEEEIKKEQAREKFSESYTNMTDQINRVSGKKFSLWNKLTMWIYEKIFGPSYNFVESQELDELKESSKAFDKVSGMFQKKEDDSMDGEEVFPYVKKNFDR